MAPLLELEAISKQFAHTTALHQASLRVHPARVHVLLGENGAGKTTLMRIAFGMVRPDAGVVRAHGAPRTFRSPADAIATGIGMVHQHYTLVPAMSVAENVALARCGPGLFHPAEAAQVVRDIARQSGLDVDPLQQVSELGVAAQQRVEILKALATSAKLLILDEPTAVLAPAEAEELLAWVRRFRNGGGGVVLITHKLREALAVADDITVLRHGRVVLTGERHLLDEQQVVGALLGEERTMADSAPAGVVRTDKQTVIVAEARSIEIRDRREVVRIRNATLRVTAGEIVGIAAIEGAGQRELLRVLAGRAPVAAGELHLPEAIGFIPEDRQRDALVLDLTITENVALRGAGRRHGYMSWSTWTSVARELVASYDVRGGGTAVPVAALSGGNQQKLVLARELGARPALVVAENPTRGLDLRATATVYARLREARDAGAGVIFYSSDLDEILGLADRVLVVFGDTLSEIAKDRELVGRAMVGAA